MEDTHLVQKDNMLQVNLNVLTSIDTQTTSFDTAYSPEYVINDSAIVQIRVDSQAGIINHSNQNNTVHYRTLIFIKFSKLPENQYSYTIKFASKMLKIIDKCFTSDDGIWHLVHESKELNTVFDVTVYMDTVRIPNPGTFAALHEDEVLTDFELQGDDGSVRVHKAVLAASSPVLRKMLQGSWRETKEGRIDVPETSKTTLQVLKDYIYLGVLPDVGLEQLLLLASYYIMPELEQRCLDKLVAGSNAENSCDLFTFAITRRMDELFIGLLERVKSGALDLDEMRDHVYKNSSDSKYIFTM